MFVMTSLSRNDSHLAKSNWKNFVNFHVAAYSSPIVFVLSYLTDNKKWSSMSCLWNLQVTEKSKSSSSYGERSMLVANWPRSATVTHELLAYDLNVDN